MRESLVDRSAVERLLLIVGALRSGLVDALAHEEAASVERVAEVAGTDPRATRIVLDALAGEGLVERRPAPAGSPAGMPLAATGAPPLYSLTPLARAHLVDEGPELERSGLIHQAHKMRGWLQLDEVIRTGRPAPRDRANHDVRAMVSAMGERESEVLDEIVSRCFAYAGHIGSMIDVGGAVGHLTRRFVRRGVKATLFDRDETLPIARDFLGDEARSLEMLGGDFTVSLPKGPYDLVYFGNVYHIYAPETNERVTGQAFSITSPGGTIAIQDYVWDLSARAAMFAVNMLRSTESGGVWSEAEYRGWLSVAGFVDITVERLDTSGSHLVFGRRPKVYSGGPGGTSGKD